MEKGWLLILTSDRKSKVIWWPLRGQIKKTMSYLNSLTQKTYISIYIMVKRKTWILTSDQRSKVIWWPLRGHIKKTMSYLNSLTQKTYISIYIMAKG